MTDNGVNTNLLEIYLQLTPWVQAFLAFTACISVLGVAYFFKEIVRAVLQPLRHHQPKAAAPRPAGKQDQAVDVRILDHRRRLLEGMDA